MTPFIQQTTPLSQPPSHPIDPIYPTYLPIPVNLHTLTRITAYFQKHLVKRLDGIKLIPPAHARSMLKLCYPIHFQTEQINTWHQNLNFFHSLCLLLAADLLEDDGPTIIPSPHLARWLSASQAQRKNRLQTAVENGSFQHVLKRLTSTSCPVKPEHPRTLVFPTFSDHPLHPLPDENRARPFQIHMDKVEDWQWFDLYQVGRFKCNDQQFYIDQETVTQAMKVGFSQRHISWLIQSANGKRLSPHDESQLSKWVDQSRTYQLRHTVVLSVRHPQDLEPIFKNKRLRQTVVQQLSPRHIAVRHDALPQLQKALNIFDDGVQRDETLNHLESSAAWSWLGVRLLAGLRQYLPDAPAPSGALIDQLANRLSLTAHADLEATAESILENLGRTIQGKDRFFPAEETPPAEWEQAIEKAIEKECSIQLIYQSLGDKAPRSRTIWPHRIWHRSNLIYFSGWCDLAGTDLTFRLDRVREVVGGLVGQ